MITVLIPTNGRAEMLREALESVARQSAVKAIDCVTVSDNGMDKTIFGIVREFKDRLNIVYTGRVPCSAHEHGKLILADYFAGKTSKYTAILADDDWWTPGHLASALHALEATSAAAFYASCHFDVRSPNSMLYCSHNFHAWFASNFASLNCAWVLPPENTILSCIFGCIGHYSTMLIRTKAFREASYIYHEPDANFDNDVRVQYALARLAPVVYNPMPLVFVRHHDDRDCLVNFTDDERVRHRRLTTEWIIKKSGLPIKTILDKFCIHFDNCPALFKNHAVEQMSAAWALPTIRRMMKESGETYETDIPQVSRMVRMSL